MNNQTLLNEAFELKNKYERTSTALYVICLHILSEDLSDSNKIKELKFLAREGVKILQEIERQEEV
ncbi:MAG: hypothetical protein ACP5QM_07580 [Caldisericum sp.]|uniref:hypothetical protein n=1 Tax=Caldisericum sp. TaxID=2499687 RepID=UPI003D14BFC4